MESRFKRGGLCKCGADRHQQVIITPDATIIKQSCPNCKDVVIRVMHRNKPAYKAL